MNSDPTDFSSTQPYRSWAERNGFADWAVAILWLIIAFFSFQLISSIIAGIVIGMQVDSSFSMADLEELMLANLDLVFIGNSAGQIIFLGLATLFVTRLHTSRSGRWNFLRFKTDSDTPYMAGATAFLIVAVQPTVWFLAWLNAQIPVPVFFEQMQATQMEMIEQFLSGDHLVWLTLFHVGIVPAVCEEILYRGYVLKALEKSWGILVAIVLSGLLFGLYHLQLTNLLPLATIGMLLGFVTWVSRSIYPAMLAHFINNGGSVLVGTYYPDSALAEITPESMPPLWSLIFSLILSAFLVYFMYQRYQKMPAKGE